MAYGKARERLSRLAEAAAASDRAAELARLRFRGGVDDFLQVLDAERSLLLAQDQETSRFDLPRSSWKSCRQG